MDGRALEALEKNGGGDDGGGGEEDVVGRRDQGSIEEVQCFLKTFSVDVRAVEERAYVEVDDFCQQSHDDEDKQDVEEPFLELATVRSRCLCDDCRTQALGRDYTEASNQTADSQVDHHGLLSILGAEVEGDDKAGDDDDTGEAEEAGRNDPLLHVLDGRHGRLFWGAEGDDDGAHDAVEAADFADEAQALLEEDGGEDSADDDGEGTHGRHKDGVCEGVCDEIAHLDVPLAAGVLFE